MGMYTIWRGYLRDRYGISYKPKYKLWQDPSKSRSGRSGGYRKSSSSSGSGRKYSKSKGKRKYSSYRRKKNTGFYLQNLLELFNYRNPRHNLRKVQIISNSVRNQNGFFLDLMDVTKQALDIDPQNDKEFRNEMLAKITALLGDIIDSNDYERGKRELYLLELKIKNRNK